MIDSFFKHINEYDELTKVYRRDAIISYADYLIENNEPFSFCILDIDNFKSINDTYGHLVGDEVLKIAAKSLADITSKHNGAIGRFGGDEFILIFKVQEYDDIWKIAFELLKSTSNLEFSNTSIDLSYTLGVSRFPLNSNNVSELIDLADKALYRGKVKGRNCFIIYLPEKHANIKLEAIREKSYSPLFLHSKIYNMLTKNDNIDENIKNVIDFVGSYYLIDSLCIENNNELKFIYKHPLYKDKELKPYGSNVIETALSTNGVFIDNRLLKNPMKDTNPLMSEMLKQGVYSSVISKIQAFGKTYGYLRADVTSVDTGRIWQNEDLISIECLSNYIALILYSKDK